MNFAEVTTDGLTDTGPLANAILETDLLKILLLAPQTIFYEAPPRKSNYYLQTDI